MCTLVGAVIQHNSSSTHPYTQQQHQVQIHSSDSQTVSNASTPLHHPNIMPYPTSQTTNTYSIANSQGPITAVVHQRHHQHQQAQLQSMATALLQELYQQGQLQKRYHHTQQQCLSQTQACNAVLRPSQRYYVQQHQQIGKSRNYRIVHQLCNSTGVIQQQQQSSPPPY